ncbi:MAG: aldehyde dehydrogenase [Lachnospiraceae bacterium]
MRTVIEKQKTFFQSDATKSVAFRKKMLERLYRCIKEYEPEIYQALREDLHKSEAEGYLTEVQIVLNELRVSIQNVEKWQKKRKVPTPITHFPETSVIYREPYGRVLILSPWNYPFQLAMVPLIGAITGGNCAMLKVSKSAPRVASVIRKILKKAFSEEFVYCIPEEVVYDEILELPYDFIFFTGSERVGKVVMSAAAQHLTPVVLELGGKSPCIIEQSANLSLAAKRLAWGKFLNSGQTCVAPDYVLIQDCVKEEFIEKLQKEIKKMYGDALTNYEYPRIVNSHHFKRLTKLIADEPEKIGGRSNEKMLMIEPTLFPNASYEDPVMQEEIFGPILPIISFHEMKDVVVQLKNRPKPLAFYLFSQNKTIVEEVIYKLPFGGGCVNDCIMHLANHHLPFGGAGNSGMGEYHGKYTFDTFTRKKGVLKDRGRIDLPFRYPPYKKKMLALIRKICG